jgi:integrase
MVNGQLPIYISVNLNKRRFKIASKLSVNPNGWDAQKGLPRGSTIDIKQLNMKLVEIKSKFFDCYHKLTISNSSFSIEDIKNLYFGVNDAEYTLMNLFDYHLETSVNTLCSGTISHYIVTQRYFKEFLVSTMNKTDISLSQLNLKFITDFEQYIYRRNKGEHRICNKNAIMKHIVRLRKVVNIAIQNDWLVKDPFMKFKISYNPTNREFLSLDEFQSIENALFKNPMLELVKDLFVFSCYTGLAYIDAMSLSTDNLGIGIDKELWIKTTRTKTDVPVNVPILPKAVAIIKKYENTTFLRLPKHVLPTLSNMTINTNLKIIAKICGITKPLSFHIARHTFATTVTLTNGVPIETVSKMLGHSSIKTTQIYAKVVDSKISSDMQVLRQKLDMQNTSEKLAKTAN